MRRKLLFICTLIMGGAMPFGAHAQDGDDIIRGIMGGIFGEIERREQRRGEKDFARRIEPFWRGCAAGDIAACHSAAQFPLNSEGRAQLRENLQRAEIEHKTFQHNWYECANGNSVACDAALAYPFATERDILITWRETAIEHARLEHDRREAERRESEEHARAELARSRQAYPVAPAATHAAAQAAHSVPAQAPASSVGSSTDLIVRGFAILSFMSLFLLIGMRDPLAPVSAFASLVRNAFRPSSRSPQRDTNVMIDDRELLVGTRRPTFAGPPPLPGNPELLAAMAPGQDKLKIKISRGQVAGLTGKVTFWVKFIAELSPEARDAVRRYRFGKTVLYQKDPKLDESINIFRLLWRFLWLWLTRKRWQITISDLVHGRTIECKDILDVLDVEERIMGAAKTFASVLRTASWFGGEEIVEL